MHKAWGVSPRNLEQWKWKPMKWAAGRSRGNLSPASAGSKKWSIFPGADAPGFMPAPASQAEAVPAAYSVLFEIIELSWGVRGDFYCHPAQKG